MNIHLICCEGPEWSHPIGAHTDPAEAAKECKALDGSLDQKNVFQALSKHVVHTVALRGVPEAKDMPSFFVRQERDQARAAASALRTMIANAISQYEEDGDVDALIEALKEDK